MRAIDNLDYSFAPEEFKTLLKSCETITPHDGRNATLTHKNGCVYDLEFESDSYCTLTGESITTPTHVITVYDSDVVTLTAKDKKKRRLTVTFRRQELVDHDKTRYISGGPQAYYTLTQVNPPEYPITGKNLKKVLEGIDFERVDRGEENTALLLYTDDDTRYVTLPLDVTVIRGPGDGTIHYDTVNSRKGHMVAVDEMNTPIFTLDYPEDTTMTLEIYPN